MFRLLLLLVVAAPMLGAQTTWRLDREPAVAVAATAPDGTLQFGAAIWAARLSSGEIAIADAIDGMLRIAGPDGRVTRSLGRKGRGPGEFEMLTWVGSCGGDTLYTWDMAATRVSVFHVVDGFSRQFNVPNGNGWSAACSHRGDFAVMSRPDQQGPAPADASGKTTDGGTYEVRRMIASLILMDAAGTELATVPRVLWAEFIAGRLREGGGLGVLPRPLGAATSYTFADGRLVVAGTDSGRVAVYDRSGARAAGFTVQVGDGAPTAQQYERAITPAIVTAPQSRHEELIAFAMSAPPPKHLPAFSHVFADSSGLIWIVNSMDGDAVTRLTAHRPTGAVVGTLEIPFAISLFEIGTDYILGRIEDAAGDQSVVLYNFTRGK